MEQEAHSGTQHKTTDRSLCEFSCTGTVATHTRVCTSGSKVTCAYVWTDDVISSFLNTPFSFEEPLWDTEEIKSLAVHYNYKKTNMVSHIMFFVCVYDDLWWKQIHRGLIVLQIQMLQITLGFTLRQTCPVWKLDKLCGFPAHSLVSSSCPKTGVLAMLNCHGVNKCVYVNFPALVQVFLSLAADPVHPGLKRLLFYLLI